MKSGAARVRHTVTPKDKVSRSAASVSPDLIREAIDEDHLLQVDFAILDGYLEFVSRFEEFAETLVDQGAFQPPADAKRVELESDPVWDQLSTMGQQAIMMSQSLKDSLISLEHSNTDGSQFFVPEKLAQSVMDARHQLLEIGRQFFWLD